jgi:hypothetical protein
MRQQLFFDMKLHLTVVQLMDLDCPLFRKDSGKGLRAEMLNAAHELLQIMMHGNILVQEAVAHRLDLLLEHASVVPSLPMTLRALFEGNKTLCQGLSDSVLNVMMTTMKHNTS